MQRLAPPPPHPRKPRRPLPSRSPPASPPSPSTAACSSSSPTIPPPSRATRSTTPRAPRSSSAPPSTASPPASPSPYTKIRKHIDGYPVRTLADVPPGDYYVQALLNIYETFHRADGKTIKLAPDRGEGQHWNLAPGNLYTKPVKIHIGPGAPPIAISLTEIIPPIPPMPTPNTSATSASRAALLTKFWGTPMFSPPSSSLPEGFDEHPNAHFPLMIFHGHFATGFADFRTTPPDPNLKPDYSERFHLAGYNRIQQQEAYKFYQQWIAPGFPRFLIVKIQHANPYYDDSYAVNSANLGPYGDAIETELIPAIEKQFRGIGQGWARFLYGGSTGGWEASRSAGLLSRPLQRRLRRLPRSHRLPRLQHRRSLQRGERCSVPGANKQVAQPAMRNYLGHTSSPSATTRLRAALGDHGRSGEQFDIWQAVYSPSAPTAIPQPIFDKKTGVIDHNVADYWHEHYDLDCDPAARLGQARPQAPGQDPHLRRLR